MQQEPGGNVPTITASDFEVPGWDDFIEGLRGIPQRMIGMLPEDQKRDPQIRQEIGAQVLKALASQLFDVLGGDGDAPLFIPTLNFLMSTGQPNCDTIYRRAKITPGGTYRITGKRGSLFYAALTQVVPAAVQLADEGSSANSAAGGTILLSDLTIDANGRFDLLVSQSRPEGLTGDWWPLHPAADSLLLRMMAVDWDTEEDPTFSIERLDRPIGRPRRPAAELEARLRRLSVLTGGMAVLFPDRYAQYRADGYVNKLKNVEVLLGAEGQYYYEGTYEVDDDEALIVESPVPAVCGYRSLLLTSDLYETTDWFNNHTCLNNTQAPLDSDGKLRIVVSAQDPGVLNWLDTTGHPRGMMQGRWWFSDSAPVPTITRVKLAELRQHLPADVRTVSPEERQAILRRRRRTLLQRPYW